MTAGATGRAEGAEGGGRGRSRGAVLRGRAGGASARTRAGGAAGEGAKKRKRVPAPGRITLAVAASARFMSVPAGQEDRDRDPRDQVSQDVAADVVHPEDGRVGV